MTIDNISEKIAKDIGLSEHKVREINRVQWKFLLDTIQSGTFDPVHIIYLGKFFKNQRYNEDRTKRYTTNSSGLHK